MMDSGYIKLYRSLLEDPIWTNSTAEQCVILIQLLFFVTWKPKKWDVFGRQFTLNPGQGFVSIRDFSKICGHGVSRQKVRTAFKRFENLGFLTQEPTQKGTLITIVNWRKYQGLVDDANPSANPTLTQGQPNPNPTIKEESKKDKKDKNSKNDKKDKNKDIFQKIIKEFSAGNEPLEQAITDWIDMRASLKKPVSTERALKLNLDKLFKLSNGFQPDMLDIVNQSIMNSWQGFFALKGTQRSTDDKKEAIDVVRRLQEKYESAECNGK
jgi:hypothetical protein|nr:MAG TPA: replisome organizer [Caudoviricetes sp.]